MTAAPTRFLRRLRYFLAKPRLVVQEKPVIIDDAGRCENPIFLVGVHRSGTSLVRRMFNCHPNIACPPESYFIPHYLALWRDPMTEAGYEGFGYDREAMRRFIARQAGELHEAYRIARGKARWADKTPQYTAHLAGLQELFGPAARFVMIYRDPMDIAFSILERKWRFREDGRPLFESTLDYVAGAVGGMLDFEARNPAAVARLRYERLVVAPEAELAPALAALGEPYAPEMLDFAQGSHNFGTEDPMVLGTRALAPSIGNWKSLPGGQVRAMRARFAEIMARLDPA